MIDLRSSESNPQGHEVTIMRRYSDYIVCRRHLQIETVSDGTGEASYRLQLKGLPTPVASRQVTVDIKVPPNLRRNPVVILDGQPQPGLLIKLDTLRVTVDLSQPITLSVGGSSQ